MVLRLKRKSDTLLIVSAIVLMNSCMTPNKKDFIAPTRELKSRIIMDKDSSLLIGEYAMITVLNNNVYIYDDYGEYNLTQYNVTDKTVSRFCRKGRGPGKL